MLDNAARLQALYEFRKPRPTLEEVILDPTGYTNTFQQFTENMND